MTSCHRAALVSCVALLSLRCEPDVELFRATAVVRPDAQTPRWMEVASGTSADLRALWGAAPGDVWAVGNGGVAMHWDGSAWRAFTTGTAANLTSVWVGRANDAWAVGASGDGSTVLLRWDGSRWSVAPSPQRGPRTSLRAVWGASPESVWLTGVADAPDPPAWRWDGAQWRPEFMSGGMRPPPFFAISGSGDDVWLGADLPAFVRHTFSGWEAPLLLPRGVSFDGGLCVSSDRSLWVASGANVLRFTSTWAMSPLASMGAVRGLWCVAADDVWAVGDAAQVARWDGARWTLSPLPRSGLSAVWRATSGEVWAVGARGVILRYGR